VNIGTIEAALVLNDAFTGVLDGAVQKIQETETIFERFGRRMKVAGGVATAGITLPFVGFSTLGLKFAADVEESENLFVESFGSMAKAARTTRRTGSPILRRRPRT
jgi:hypothetical protein